MSDVSLKAALNRFSYAVEKLVEEINSTENTEVVKKLDNRIAENYPFIESLDEVNVKGWVEGVLEGIDFSMSDLIGLTYDDAVDLLGEPSFSTSGGLYGRKKHWYFFHDSVKLLIDTSSGVVLEVVE